MCTTASGATVRVVRRDAVTVAPQAAGAAKRPLCIRLPRPPKPLKALAVRPAAAEPTERKRKDSERVAAERAPATTAAATRDFLVRQSIAVRHAGPAPLAVDSYERSAALLERVRSRQAVAVAAVGGSSGGAVSPCES